MDRLTNGDSELVCVRDSGELAAGILPLVTDGEKIVVLREDEAAQTCCAFQQSFVISVRCPILFGD